MKLDIHEIQHQYIIRVVIFSLFLFKRQIRQPSVYKLSVTSFINKRIPWDIDLRINTGLKLDKKVERDILLGELLDGVESDHLTKIKISFASPLKDVKMEIDLKDEDKYQEFLYK